MDGGLSLELLPRIVVLPALYHGRHVGVLPWIVLLATMPLYVPLLPRLVVLAALPDLVKLQWDLQRRPALDASMRGNAFLLPSSRDVFKFSFYPS